MSKRFRLPFCLMPKLSGAGLTFLAIGTDWLSQILTEKSGIGTVTFPASRTGDFVAADSALCRRYGAIVD
jgi:hypothetical protein